MVVLNKLLSTMLTALLLLLSAAANAGPLPLWEIDSADNRVLIMGSVHFLRPTDYPLRDGLNEAHEIADSIVMEIDMAAVDATAAAAVIASMSVDPEGRTLQELVGKEAYAKAQELAAELNIPLATFAGFEPWFAALSITQMRMLQLGFDPAWGIETMLTRKAQTEGKPVSGLETMAEQLGFMDRLNSETQRQFLIESLEDATTIQNMMDDIVTAWTNGDSAALADLLLEDREAVPELFDAILVERNRNWVEDIAALRDKPGNHLVVVGAGHLVGEDSVLDMLADAGINSRQLTDADF